MEEPWGNITNLNKAPNSFTTASLFQVFGRAFKEEQEQGGYQQQEANSSAVEIIAAERQEPEGDGENGELGFDCCPFNYAMHGYDNATLPSK